MVDMHENCTCRCLNCCTIFIPVTIGKPCFKCNYFIANIGAYVIAPFIIING